MRFSQRAILFALAAGAVCGQDTKIGDVAFSGSLRSRMYDWDWFQPISGNNNYIYSGNILRLKFSQNHDSWDWTAEFAVPFLLGLPANATGTGPQQGALGLGSNYASANGGSRNAALLFPKQLFVRWNGLGGNKAHTLQIGRFTFLDGSETAPKNATISALKRDRINQRLIGDFGWSDVGRSFDGVRYSYAKGSDNFTFVAAVPTRGVFQVDGWGWNRVGLGYASYTHDATKGRHTSDSRLFVIEYDDFRPIVKTDDRAAAIRSRDFDNIRIDTFGGHTAQAFDTRAGTIDVLLWGAAQTGRWGVQRQRAASLDIEGGFQPKLLPKLKPWIRGGFNWNSGDSNPNDNTHGTFFQVLPTPRPYARMPFFNMMNSTDAFGTLMVRPHSKLAVSSEFHSLRLSNSNDLWYSGGGAFQPWTFGYAGRSTAGRRSLANLYDTSAEVLVNRNITVVAYVGYAQGLAAMEHIYSNGKDARFGYLEISCRF